MGVIKSNIFNNIAIAILDSSLLLLSGISFMFLFFIALFIVIALKGNSNSVLLLFAISFRRNNYTVAIQKTNTKNEANRLRAIIK